MNYPSPDRRALEDHWRDRLKDAKTRLEFARSYLREVQQDYQSGALPSPDGSYAYQRAVRAEAAALAEYVRVLRIFSELAMDGKIPESGSPGEAA